MKDDLAPEPPIVINGRAYPLWSQFVQRKSEWIGGVLEDFGEYSATPKYRTEITDIKLEPNGDGAWFEVTGADFHCGFDVAYGGMMSGDEGYVTFSGFQNHVWRIAKPAKAPAEPQLPLA